MQFLQLLFKWIVHSNHKGDLEGTVKMILIYGASIESARGTAKIYNERHGDRNGLQILRKFKESTYM